MNFLKDFLLAERIGIEKRCGFWEVDNLFFFDKLECLKHASKKNIESNSIKFHFYDSVFGSLNWKKEPEKSLKELYKERALQLRQKYDYLILLFSGGSDSLNILNTFIDNKIKLDEVYCEYPIEFVEKYNIFKSHLKDYDHRILHRDPNLLMYEWFSAKPILQKLSQTNPEIKITTVSTNFEIAIKRIDNSELHKNIKNSGLVSSVSKFKELYDCIKNKSNVGCITGIDKPRLVYNFKSNKFYSSFEDVSNAAAMQFINIDLNYNNPITFDHFYYAYDYPELNQKMCFVLKNAILELMNNRKKDYLKPIIHKTDEFGNVTFDDHNNYFKKLLYNWDNSIWQAKKSPSFYYLPINGWLHSSKVTTEKTRHFFDMQLKDLLYGISDTFISYNRNNNPDKITNFRTRMYEF